MDYSKFLNLNNLRIARINSGLETRDASKSISQSKKDLVASWESGEAVPTWKQLVKLAKIYNLPVLIFCSPSIIEENKKIPDFRTGVSETDNKDIGKLINIILKRQGWLESELIKSGKGKNQLVGSGSNIKTPGELASFIKEKLNVKLEDIKSFSGIDAGARTLKYLIAKAENKNIFIGKTISYHDIEVENMRGIFISNDYCPYIIINRKDSYSAQIFTLVHELAHLFRRTDGISNSVDFRTLDDKTVDTEEVFCNKVVAEFILPEEELKNNTYSLDDIKKLSEIYKISILSIFYRLKSLKKINRDDISWMENEIKKNISNNLKSRKKESSGGNFYNNMKDSNGSLFNRIVEQSYTNNNIGYVEASNLLNFSADNI
jgi:Zn-dependent peptidase ImmA (M78 family)